MAIRLRTRLFLGVGALLAASVMVSAFLSRQVTLVEVREFVTTAPAARGATEVLDRAAEAVREHPVDRLNTALAQLAASSGQRIVVSSGGRIVAASDAPLAAARVREIDATGTFVADVPIGEGEAAIAIRGALTREAQTAAGQQVIVFLLPPLDAPPERAAAAVHSEIPGWVWTTAATVLVAVPLVFAVSRRILNPVGALTAAARRMREGELGVTVPDGGGDELAELARAFNQMSARVAENERLRQQMVSDVAHELRSPVTNLRCTLEAIQDGLVSADRASLEVLYDETLFLQRLIADLEQLALADAGQLTIARRPLDIGLVVRKAVGAAAGPGGPAITLDIGPDLPQMDGDADRLEQVIRNLLTNARIHTPPDGRIDVQVAAEVSGIRIDVSDSGAGIDSAHLPHLFDRFYRADRSRTRATGGAGLGLAIARQLVLAHGGTISAASRGPGTGACFTVRLPAAR